MSGHGHGDRVSPIINNVERDLNNQRRLRNERRRNNINPRDRLFHALFIKIGNIYSRCFPQWFRTILEVVVLVQGLLLFTLLSYLHFSFGKYPMSCLNATKGSWPQDGVLRVQIREELPTRSEILQTHFPNLLRINFNAFSLSPVVHSCYDNTFSKSNCPNIFTELKDFYSYKRRQYEINNQSYQMNYSDYLCQVDYKHCHEWVNYLKVINSIPEFHKYNKEESLFGFYKEYLRNNTDLHRSYIFEYSQEFGFLRLSPETRARLKIPVKVVILDPNKEKCFGDRFSRFILKYFLGYDEALMSSIKKIADSQNNTGYMLNVVTRDHYKFIPWGIGHSSYVISLLLMFLFTISISTLLRYCHQQVFFFIIRILQMLNMNIVLAFPVAPLFTVVLSLVGMETIMSEYFNDATTSFYIILIVWAVDQFDTICCHTEISQKYWLRFFYLYHFIFYAYHYRFNGQYSSLALAATWFMIQHSMLYFFHNYELPALEERLNANNNEDAYLDEAVEMIVDGIELVAGQQQQQQQQRQGVALVDMHPTQGNQEQTVDEILQDPNEAVRDTNVSSSTTGNNRIFVFGADRSILEMVRDVIRHVYDRMIVERTPVAVIVERSNVDALSSEESVEGLQHSSGSDTDVVVSPERISTAECAQPIQEEHEEKDQNNRQTLDRSQLDDSQQVTDAMDSLNNRSCAGPSSNS